MNLKQQAAKNLIDFKGILDYLGVSFWLDGGTLLGAIRDKDFCDGDADDVDICAYVTDMDKVSRIVKMAETVGFELYIQWPLQIAMKRGGSKIDLFFNVYDRHYDVYWTCLYKGKLIEKYIVIPQKFYHNLSPIEFKGEEFYTPSYVEEYLTLKYGDWKTPVHRSEYSCYNAEQNKIVVDKLPWVK